MRLRARVTEHTPLFKNGVQVGTYGPHGPYMWFFVVRTKQGLALGSIYRQQGDDLTDAEVSEAKKALDEARYEVEEC